MNQRGKKNLKSHKNDSMYHKAHYNYKHKNVFNSVGKYYNPDSKSNVTFVRDPEKLLVQYDNLIKSLGKKYGKYFTSYADKQELYSYISDTFISLVYEYDMDSGVDFQGYIKRMLEFRIRASYSKPEKNRKEHILMSKDSDMSIEKVTDTKHALGKQQVYSYRLSKKSPYKKKLPNGDEVGVEVKVVDTKTANEIDDSLLEVNSLLDEHHSNSEIKQHLIRHLINRGAKPKDACVDVAKEMNLNVELVEREFAELKSILTVI